MRPPHEIEVASAAHAREFVEPPENPTPVGRLREGDLTRIQLREQLREKAGRPGAPATLPTLPGIDSISLATRYLDGGRQQFIEVVQMAMLNNEPLACKWWAVYADLAPYPRSLVSFDDICAAAGVEPAALCGLIVSTAMRFGRDVANLVAALTHPKVVAAQVKSAERIDGPFAELAFKDRAAFLQAMGSNVVPKGAVIVNVTANANAQAAAQATAVEPTVPSFADDLDLFKQPSRPQLTPADPALAPIDVTAQPVREPADV